MLKDKQPAPAHPLLDIRYAQLTAGQQQVLLKLARRAVTAQLQGRCVLECTTPPDPLLTPCAGVFVTLRRLRPDAEPLLRG